MAMFPSHHNELPYDTVVGDVLYVPAPYVGCRLAPNAATAIRRRESGELVFTNARGWRGRAPGPGAMDKAEILVTGCSFPLGTGMPYELSQIGFLEERLGVPIANASVGGYSMLQSARRAEEELPHARASLILLPLLSGTIDRVARENHVDQVIFRPIFRRRADGVMFLQEPVLMPMALYVAYARLLRKVRLPQVRGMNPVQLVMKLWNGNKIGNLIKRLVDRQTAYIDPFDRELRQRAIETSVRLLSDAAKKGGARVLICHLFDFAHYRQNKKIREAQNFDRNILSEVVKQYPDVTYVPWDAMEQSLDRYFAARNATMEDFARHIWLSDNNHPNEAGQRLIADFLYEAVRTHS